LIPPELNPFNLNTSLASRQLCLHAVAAPFAAQQSALSTRETRSMHLEEQSHYFIREQGTKYTNPSFLSGRVLMVLQLYPRI
jgi:hypothetical protein